MASTYSVNLKIELLGTGDQVGTWGDITNTNLGTALEQAIVGRGTALFPADANLTITLTNSNEAQAARCYALHVTSSVSLTATRNLVVPTINKPYLVLNATTGGQSIVVKTSAGTGVTIPNGKECLVYVDGTNVVAAFDYAPALELGAPLAISSGGTGANTLVGAKAALGITGAALGSIAWTARSDTEMLADGYLRCDGSAYLQSAYPELFAAIGLLKNYRRIPFIQRTAPFGTEVITAVGYGNGLFVVGSTAGKLATSPDGVAWTTRVSPFGTAPVYGIIHANGLYIAFAGSGLIATSPDGVTWTARVSGFGASAVSGGTYGNGVFVIVGEGGKISTSSDGVNWTLRTNGFGTNTISDVSFGAGVFIAVGQTGVYGYSSDGVTWAMSQPYGVAGGDLKGVSYGNGTFVAIYADVDKTFALRTKDGLGALQQTVPFRGTAGAYRVRFARGMFFVTGIGGLLTSTDGVVWDLQPIVGSFGLTNTPAVAYGAGTVVVAGNPTLGQGAAIFTDTYTYNSATHFITPDIPASPTGEMAWIKAT